MNRLCIFLTLICLNSSLFGQLPGKKELAAFTKDLKSTNVIDNENFLLLNSAIEKGTVTTSFDCLSYCKNAKIIFTEKNPSFPTEYIKRISAEIASVIPKINRGEFVVCNSRFEKSPCSSQSNIIVDKEEPISFTATPHHSWEVHLHNPLDSAAARKKMCKCIDTETELVELYNSFLDDHRSQQKIAIVYQSKQRADPSTGENIFEYSDSVFGVIGLNKNQIRKFFNSKSNPWNIGAEEYKGFITKENTRDAIGTFSSSGLFAHLKDTDIAKATDKAMGGLYINFNEVLNLFPNTTLSYNNPAASPKTYAKLLDDLSTLSRGAFAPEKTVEQNNGSTIILSFEINGKQYKENLLSYDVQDFKLIQVINLALTASGSKGKFYHLYVAKQSNLGTNAKNIVFLTATQYQTLTKSDRLTFLPENGLFEEEWPGYIRKAEQSWAKYYKKK